MENKLDLNELYLIVNKDNDKSNNITDIKINNIFNFNDYNKDGFTLFLSLVSYSKDNASNNILKKEDLNNMDIHIKNDLSFQVPFNRYGKKYEFCSYYPYAMQQAHFQYKIGINIKIIEELYNFSEDEIKQGYAVKSGLKEEFYPMLMEFNKQGYFYFHHTITELPEFVSQDALQLLTK